MQQVNFETFMKNIPSGGIKDKEYVLQCMFFVTSVAEDPSGWIRD